MKKEIAISVVLKVSNESEVADLMMEVVERITNGYSSGKFKSSDNSVVDFKVEDLDGK